MVIKVYNKPTLFVNSISIGTVGKENQNYYDSRRNIKGKVYHRIDDIISLMSYGRRVHGIFNYLNTLYVGEVIGINYNYVIIKNECSVKSLEIKNILDIKITS